MFLFASSTQNTHYVQSLNSLVMVQAFAIIFCNSSLVFHVLNLSWSGLPAMAFFVFIHWEYTRLLSGIWLVDFAWLDHPHGLIESRRVCAISF